MHRNAQGKLGFVEMESLTSDYTSALEGMDAVIHCASATFFRVASTQDLLEVRPSSAFPYHCLIRSSQSAYNGSLNIINAAIAAGIKKIVVTGTIANVDDSEPPLLPRLACSATDFP
jgi:nucleoside-diphosphate-sugar epimerase